MKRYGKFTIILALILLVSGCAGLPFVSPEMTQNAPAKVATQPVEPGEVPDVKITTQAYLDAWKADDFTSMYTLLTSISKDAISEDEFFEHYAGVAKEAALEGLEYEILSAFTKPDSAQVSYRVTLNSILVGDITRETVMNLSLEDGEWRVQWDDTLILPEFQGGNYLAMQSVGLCSFARQYL